MLTYSDDAATRTAEIIVDGRITREDFDTIAPQIEAFVDAHAPIGFVEVIHRFDGFEASLLWDGIKLDRRLLPHIEKVAVVGDQGWLTPISKAAGAVLSTKLRTFALADLEDARAWARRRDMPEG